MRYKPKTKLIVSIVTVYTENIIQIIVMLVGEIDASIW